MTVGPEQRGRRLVRGSDPRWVLALHAAVEGLMISVALFTVLHLVAVGLDWPARPVGWTWLALSIVVVGGTVRRAMRVDPSYVRAPLPPSSRGRGAPMLLLGFTFVATVLAMAVPSELFRLFWVVGALAAGGGLYWTVGPTRPRRPDTPLVAAPREHGAALAMSAGLAAFMMFLRNPSPDDAAFLSRSVWVDERGTFSDRDTLFGPETFALTHWGGLPVSAMDDLYGTVARMTGLTVGDVVYLGATPVLAFLAAWSAWRLVAWWSLHNRVLVFAVALAVPLFAATGALGDLGYAHIWQGRAIAVMVVAPLAWMHLTRLGGALVTRDQRRWSWFVLATLGIAWCGLSIGAPLFGLMPALAAVVTATLSRVARRRMLLGAAALGAGPLLTGVATAVAGWQDTGRPRIVFGSAAAGWHRALGDDRLVVGIVVVGLLVGSLLVRRGAGRTLATTATVLVFVSTAPGFFLLFEALTGAGQATPRLLLVAPIPVLVGLLCSAAQPGSDVDQGGAERTWLQYAGAGVAPLLVALLALFGTSVWSAEGGGDLTARPTWKVPPQALENVRAVVAERPGPGPVLLPTQEMQVLPVVTSRLFAVAPLSRSVDELVEGEARQAERRQLLRFADDVNDDASVPDVRRALEALDVSLACARAEDGAQVSVLERTRYGTRHRVAGLVCFDPKG